MARYEDTTPSPRFLRSLRSQDWNASGALSELVDNSFGSARGDAARVWIRWDKGARTFEVLDNGVGMNNLTDLFKLGSIPARGARDIGEFGAGGTLALLWLGKRVNVWTLRDGMVSISGTVDWDDLIRKEEYPRVDSDWYPATEANTPQRLLDLGSGTLIRIQLPRGRKPWDHNIRRDLARNYGPALRHGRRITWETVNVRGDFDKIELSERVHSLSHPKHLLVNIEINGELLLTASGRAAVVPDLPLSESSIAVCFGHRVLRSTRDCYRSLDGSGPSYDGIGVTGYVDLDDGWQPFLLTTKTGIADDRIWEALMGELYSQLSPLLDRVQRQREYVLLEGISLDLEKIFNKNLSSMVEGPVTHPDPEGDSRTGKLRKGPEAEHEPREPATPEPEKKEGALQLEIVQVGEEDTGGSLVVVELIGKGSLSCFVNSDHELVRRALIERPPNRTALHLLIVERIAEQVRHFHPELLRRMFHKDVLEKIDGTKDSWRSGLIGRLLIDRVRDDVH